MIFIFSQISFSASSSSNWKLGVGFGYSINYLVNLSGSGVSSGTPYKITYYFEFSSATSIALDLRKLNKNNWGIMSGFEYETERTLTKLVANGIIIPLSGGATAKYQSHFLHLGAAYRWDIFYVPVGLTYGLTTFTPAPGSTGTASIENGFGGYFGLGWYVDDDIVIEYVGRSVTTSLKVTSGADSETTSGTIGSALLGLKAFF